MEEFTVTFDELMTLRNLKFIQLITEHAYIRDVKNFLDFFFQISDEAFFHIIL